LVTEITAICFVVQRQNAVAVPFEESRVFSISSDTRIRVECQVEKNGFYFLAEALVDGGDTEELYLPARKIFQLGLRQLGKPYTGKSSHNTAHEHLRFEPVLVKIKFSREKTEEIYEEYLNVHCLKSEYDTVMNNVDKEVSPLQPIQGKMDNPVHSSCDSPQQQSASLQVKLSPVTHRRLSNRDQRVCLGNRGLAKLHLIAKFDAGVLEHEEDFQYEEECLSISLSG